MPDASVGASIDAPIDAPPPVDAMRPACDIAGLACSGTATSFPCGGNCWVLCTGNVVASAARTACTGWRGTPGEIGDATEQGCVAAYVATHAAAATWIGLVQIPTATTPGTGWTWNGTTPLDYTHWLSGKPDDGDNHESGAEQCASIGTDGTWDDQNCNSSLDFLCERP